MSLSPASTGPAGPHGWPTPPALPPQGGVLQGPLGLRAGWGIALFLLFFFVGSVTIRIGALAAAGKLRGVIAEQRSAAADQRAGKPLPAAKDTGVDDTAIVEAIDAVSVGLAALAMAAIERRRFGVYGIGVARWRDGLAGGFWGVVSLAALVGILRAMHVLVFDGRLLFGGQAVLYGVKWLVAFFFVGVFEESLTRGYLQYTLTRGNFSLSDPSPAHARTIAFWRGALLMSAVFGLSHLGNRNETGVGIFVACLAGLVFSYALWRTGSLWWAIGFHTAWDWAQSFLFGVPDSGQISAGRLFQTHPVGAVSLSGGIAGPEGSIFVIPVLLLVAVVIRYTTRPGVQPPLAPEGVQEPGVAAAAVA